MNKPRIKPAQIKELALAAGITAAVYLVGIRGYYLDSMGKDNENDRGVYDDCIALVNGDVVETFNANVDPSVYRGGIANLIEGVWSYKIGVHGLSKPAHLRYDALVQADEVTVKRDGQKELDSGWFGINIHKGGERSTSSLGCQTIFAPQWNTFIQHVRGAMTVAKQKTIPYLLVSNDGNRII